MCARLSVFVSSFAEEENGAIKRFKKKTKKRDNHDELGIQFHASQLTSGGFAQTCGCKSDGAVEVNLLELQHVSVYVQCADVRAEVPCLQGLLHASMCLWTTIVPVCVHMYHLRYPIPDCYLLKCLWAALCGFSFIERPRRLKR